MAGKRPRSASSFRIATIARRFIPSAATVARPQAVLPCILHCFVKEKCFGHESRRGLNRRMDRPVRRSRARSLSQRTRDTGQRQIVQISGPAFRARDDVIDVKSRFLGVLRHSAILAQSSCTLSNLANKACGNVTAHAPFRAARSARSFMRESMSTNSVRALASWRSARLRFPWLF